ncbi:MAG: hypothetical protein HOQ24_04125 [Mycobacteriaceae bacterium]|nr:hypothetical protein [Mycobacteriaceae bacterium]
MKITPESLTDAAVAVGKLGEAVHDAAVFPFLGASRGVEALKGSPIADALTGADPASTQAKATLASRYEAIASMLYTTATTFKGQDQDLADQLGRIGDLNSKAN